MRSPRELSYPEVGLTAKLGEPGIRERLAARYDVDRHEATLGTGFSLFRRASSALLCWHHFEIPWLHFHGAGPAVSGQVVATVTAVAGLWFTNPCRVVYVDSRSDSNSVAYAYGTLRGHAECGEERFSISLDPSSGAVTYEISAFSRPATLLSKLGYPLARGLQRRFAAASAQALARAVAY